MKQREELMTMDEIEFATHDDVPGMDRHGPQKVDWRAITEFARAHPDVWVEVPTVLSPSVAYQIRKGAYPSISPVEFDITTRAVVGRSEGPRRSRIYVKVK